MSTNYYLRESKPCPTCGHSNKPRHIGKSSVGWVFTLRIYPEEGINTYEDWYDRWTRQGVTIIDGYGRVTPLIDMVQTVTGRIGKMKSNTPLSEGQTYEYLAVEFS